jgi:hypothetical protein
MVVLSRCTEKLSHSETERVSWGFLHGLKPRVFSGTAGAVPFPKHYEKAFEYAPLTLYITRISSDAVSKRRRAFGIWIGSLNRRCEDPKRSRVIAAAAL